MRKEFQFRTYERSELEECARQLCNFLCNTFHESDRGRHPTILWTAHVLHWFGDAAALGTTSYFRGRYGEFLLDLVHASWGTEPWHEAVARPIKLRLALECEWGVENNTARATEEILRDAAKIAVIRAEAKVVVFASCNEAHHERIVSLLTQLRAQAEDRTPWLWLDVPWWKAEPIWHPVFGVLQ